MFRVKIDYYEGGTILTRSDHLLVESVVYSIHGVPGGACIELVDLEGKNIRYGPYYHGKANVYVFAGDKIAGSYQL